MSKVLYEKDGRIGRITLNRPDVMNAIDDEVPGLIADAVEAANADPSVTPSARGSRRFEDYLVRGPRIA